jgi:hypothetical protein
VPLVGAEVRQIAHTSSMSEDSLVCLIGVEGSDPYDFNNALPGTFLSQLSPFSAQESQFPTFTLVGLRRQVD